jgi:hypothetical protein
MWTAIEVFAATGLFPLLSHMMLHLVVKAMLAAVGWPLSELWDRKIADYFDLKPVVDAAERAPSVLNGGLDKVLPGYWVACFLLGAAVEFHIYRVKNKPGYFPGNLGFDPLRLYPSDKEGQRRIQLAEIRNGRLVSAHRSDVIWRE